MKASSVYSHEVKFRPLNGSPSEPLQISLAGTTGQCVPPLEVRWSFLRPRGPPTSEQLLVAGSTHPRRNMVWEVFFPYALDGVEGINE